MKTDEEINYIFDKFSSLFRFEFNDDLTKQSAITLCYTLLNDPTYVVVCDDSNNSPSVINDDIIMHIHAPDGTYFKYSHKKWITK